MAARPLVKDISINLLNAPKELMLGSKSYALNFMILNTKSEEKDLVLTFSSDSMDLGQNVIEAKLGPQERKNFTIEAKPTADGPLDLAVAVVQRKTITWTEEVLEGQEDVVQPEPAAAPEKPGASGVKPAGAAPAPAKPVKPVKPAGAAPAPAKPVKLAGAAPAPAKPVKPVKPAATAPAPAKPVKPAGPSPMELLEKRIGEVKDAYMAARAKLQSVQQGSQEYKDIYKDALKNKDEYEKLKGIYEAGEPIPDEIIKQLGAGPAEEVDPVEELKTLMAKYNELKGKLGGLDPASSEYNSTRAEAMAVHKEYSEKLAKAKTQGLIQ